MKVYSKVVFLIMSFVLCILMINSKVVVQCATTDNGKTSYAVDFTKSSLASTYTIYRNDFGTTITSGTSSKQSVFVYMQEQTENSKVVTWAVKSDSGKLKRATVAAICEDYEKTHPDWKVIGAINADQYVTGFGTDLPGKGQDYYYPQPYYPMIADGECWFTVTAIPSIGGNVACFLQDGSNDPIRSGSANINGGDIKIAGIFLYIIDDEGNRLEKYPVANINESPVEDQTTVWTSYTNSNKVVPNIDVSGNLYVVKNAERAYAYNSIDYQYKGNDAYNALFGKGYITEVAKQATIGYGDFAIDTNNPDLQEKLSKGVRVIVQQEYADGYSDVESAVGYHTIQRMDGKDLTTTSSYNTKKYPRAIVGRTEDGKIALVAIDGNQASIGASGATFDEANAILKEYGIVEAYQMDGGGSVTAVVNRDGKFVVENSPSDGSARSDFNALLLVERRKPEISYEITNSDEVSTTFKLDIAMHGGTYSNIEFVVSGKSYDIENTSDGLFVTIGKMRRNKEYTYTINVTVEGGEVLSVQGTFTLPSLPPTLKSCSAAIVDGKRVFTITLKDTDDTLVKYYIRVGTENYELDGETITVDNLTEIPYLIIIYKIDEEEKTINIKYPQSVSLRDIDEAFWYYNQTIENIYS